MNQINNIKTKQKVTAKIDLIRLQKCGEINDKNS